MEKFPMTQKGFDKLNERLKKLKYEDRPKIIEMISEAREHGDLSENAEYHAAKERQGFIEGLIMDIESKISYADVIDVSKLTGNTIKFGATVKLLDDNTGEKLEYQIVSEDESDLSNNLLSYKSPLARAIIGRENGDVVEVKTPGGIKWYVILEIKFI